MRYEAYILVGLGWVSPFAMGCGLDWTLPTNHFDGVDEHGYVSYWEKIGAADLGDGLVIPININFNSHRESSSPLLGKGWTVALLESHVEPLDDNTMKVVMPDGWNFYFYRNTNSETWQGNAGWVGETNNTVFTITAPCGWRIKFDGGKIQEIDSNKNRTLSYKYNGPVATEVDDDGKAFVQVESDSSTGVVRDLLIDGQKIDLSQAQKPQIVTKGGQNLITGFDQSLSQLRWQNGKNESFTFGTDKRLDPALVISKGDNSKDRTGNRTLTWDAATRQIKTDGEWTYDLSPGDCVAVNRVNLKGQSQYYSNDPQIGLTVEQDIDGARIETRKFTSGDLAGLTRSVTSLVNGNRTVLEAYDYDEQGRIIRETRDGTTQINIYDIKDISAINPVASEADRVTYRDGNGNVLRVITKLTDTRVQNAALVGCSVVTTYSKGKTYARLINDKNELIGITQN